MTRAAQAGAEPTFTSAPGAHWLSSQTTSRVPRRWVFLDTEAWRDPVPGGEEQRWRLGVTARTHWRDTSRTWAPLVFVRHATSGDLWETVAAHARSGARTIVVAHNMAYDLRIADGLRWLVEHDWVISRPTFGAQSLAFQAHRDNASLTFVDNSSWLPGSLEGIAYLMGSAKLPLPSNDDPDETWYARCEQDVRILSEAHMTIIDWLSRSDSGGWARSGAGTGWHTLLRRHLTEPVLVHGQAAIREIEARAMYSGRCEVWRWGRAKGRRFYEWDFELAYGCTAASTSLPATFDGEFRGVTLATMLAGTESARWLVEAEVTTTVPVLPWSDDHGICWPVGTIDGWWWEVELAAAVEAGAKVRVKKALHYRASPWLASWATWAIELWQDKSTPQARVIGHMAKQWTRSVLGRTAMRFKDWQLTGPAYRPGVSFAEQIDLDSGKRGQLLNLGDQCWEAWDQTWWDQALPQVLSAITAECRVRLWAAMTTAGLETVIYVDTDCLIVNQVGHSRLADAKARGELWSLRLKDVHRSFEATAPQMATGVSYRRMAGIPRATWIDDKGQRWGEYWEGVTTSLNAGHPDRVQVITRPINIQGVDRRRVHLSDGQTAPFTVSKGLRSPAPPGPAPIPAG